eukprot:2962901-Pyramimonas_sp.AAC.1
MALIPFPKSTTNVSLPRWRCRASIPVGVCPRLHCSVRIAAVALPLPHCRGRTAAVAMRFPQRLCSIAQSHSR